MATASTSTVSALVVLLALSLGGATSGCGGSKTPAASPDPAVATGAPNESTKASPAPAKPVTSLKRTAVNDAISRGLGSFLQNVSVEDWPVMLEGKFHGFKIRSINPEWGIDLRAGDVVTRINGIVPEHPEEADTALRSLEKAASLKVDYEREGKARTLELPIVD